MARSKNFIDAELMQRIEIREDQQAIVCRRFIYARYVVSEHVLVHGRRLLRTTRRILLINTTIHIDVL